LLLAFGDADCLPAVAEVARRLGVSRATVYKLVAEGRLAHVRIGNSIRFWPDVRPHMPRSLV
jgi:excisionase family DNA binding protein